ncbi:MAG: YeeE/YedE family protein [Chloroflexi bacterium]|nr:YeeE/YedE family protein [Chloroflexota bacterium]
MMAAILTLLAGFFIGYLAQRSRFCMVAPIRDFILTRDWRVWQGALSLFGTTYLLYSVAGYLGWLTWDVPAFSPGLAPVLLLTGGAGLGLGLVSVLVGGCPTRQHVAAAQGSRDALYYLIGFYAGVLVYSMLTIELLEVILQ